MTTPAPATPPVVRLDPAVPLLAYAAGAPWTHERLPLTSPREDGAVAFYQDSLSRRFPSRKPEWMFEDEIGRALCKYVLGMAARNNLQISSGPYLQILDDDPSLPDNVVMIRAILWVEEYDLVVPMTADAATGLGAPPSPLLRTPAEWCSHYGIVIRDPDGWRGPNAPSWDTPITLHDFRTRVGVSTVEGMSRESWTRMGADVRDAER